MLVPAHRVVVLTVPVVMVCAWRFIAKQKARTMRSWFFSFMVFWHFILRLVFLVLPGLCWAVKTPLCWCYFQLCRRISFSRRYANTYLGFAACCNKQRNNKCSCEDVFFHVLFFLIVYFFRHEFTNEWMALVVCLCSDSLATSSKKIPSPPPLGAGLRTSICLFSFVLGMLKIYCLSKICQYKNHKASCMVLPNRFSLKRIIFWGDLVLYFKTRLWK